MAPRARSRWNAVSPTPSPPPPTEIVLPPAPRPPPSASAHVQKSSKAALRGSYRLVEDSLPGAHGVASGQELGLQ